MMIIVFFMIISLIVLMGFAVSAVGASSLAQNLLKSKQSYFLAESGGEDLAYRIIAGENYSMAEVLEIDGFYATTIVTSSAGDVILTSSGDISKDIRKTKISLSTDQGTSFHYGVQVGNGGLKMENSSSVIGNVYSNGPVEGAGSNLIKGDVVSAGASGFINRVHATSSAYAHTISNSTIDKDAYYQVIDGITKVGPDGETCLNSYCYPGSPDQATSTLPISDETINAWEQAAAVNVVSSPCPYTINSNVTLGPVKITCDLEIQGSPTITLAGMIWVTGDVVVQNTATIRLDPSLGKKSLAIIADNPVNRLTSSEIDLKNNIIFQNSGTKGSYVLLVSQNNSSESGGSEKAIIVQNSVSGTLLVYAGHGEILLQNNVNLKEVTGYKIRLQNSAEVIYETGLANLLFESGPAGSFSISSWRETE